MSYRLVIASPYPRAALETRLLAATAEGPFLVRDLSPVEAGIWAFALQPKRPEMVVGFGKIAELLVLLAREFEVQSLERTPLRAIAAAS